MKRLLCWVGIHDWRGLPLNWRVRQCTRCLKVGFRGAVVVLALLLFVGGAAACPSVRVVHHRQAVVQALAVPVLVPTYSVMYNSDQAAVLEELRRIRVALESGSVRGTEPASFQRLVASRCASCHQLKNADKGGGFVLLEDSGELPPFSLAEKRGIVRAIEEGRMPPKNPLLDSEKQIVKREFKK